MTAAFNKNVLRVLARELDGDIDERSFEHLAFYDEALERIEMHLVSMRAQTMTLRAADLRIELATGERILTEISRKFTLVQRRAHALARRHADRRMDPRGQRHVRPLRRSSRLTSA